MREGWSQLMAPALRRFVRLPVLALMVAGGLAAVFALFPFASERVRRAAIRTWSRILLAVCSVRVVDAPGPEARALADLSPGRLVVANHVSWLDIYVIHSRSPCAFVAKAELAEWPVLGILIRRTGTLFLERGKRHAVHRMAEHIARSLQAGGRIALFPEGTTSDGSKLLPFHANLMQAAVTTGTPVVPVGLKYADRDGTGARVVEYVDDMTFAASLWRIAGARGVDCEVRTAVEVVPQAGNTRHDLAARARAAIRERLDVALVDEVPDTLRRYRAAS
jgi:1-acyl-sn-glycerol-3-phosphate acyltransferase